MVYLLSTKEFAVTTPDDSPFVPEEEHIELPPETGQPVVKSTSFPHPVADGNKPDVQAPVRHVISTRKDINVYRFGLFATGGLLFPLYIAGGVFMIWKQKVNDPTILAVVTGLFVLLTLYIGYLFFRLRYVSIEGETLYLDDKPFDRKLISKTRLQKNVVFMKIDNTWYATILLNIRTRKAYRAFRQWAIEGNPYVPVKESLLVKILYYILIAAIVLLSMIVALFSYEIKSRGTQPITGPAHAASNPAFHTGLFS